jgi:hypothetical protein
VLSDDKDADLQLKEFRKGVDPWIIAVRKVSEGVDIPRLRVCVYMSNVITEMFFRQVVGRVVRYTPGIQNQEAFVYIPADSRLVEMALRIQEERLSAALQMEDEDSDDGDEQIMRELSGRASNFSVLDGTGWHESTITYNGYAFTSQEIESAKPLAAKYGIRPEIMAQMVMDGLIKGVNGHSHEQKTEDIPLYKRKRQTKTKGGKLDKLKSNCRHRFLGHVVEDKVAWSYLSAALNKAVGKRSGHDATEDQYERMIALMESALQSRDVPLWLK